MRNLVVVSIFQEIASFQNDTYRRIILKYQNLSTIFHEKLRINLNFDTDSKFVVSFLKTVFGIRFFDTYQKSRN